MGDGRPQGAGVRVLARRWMQDHLTAVEPTTYKNHARATALLDDVPTPLPPYPSVLEIAGWMRELWESGRYGSMRSVLGLRSCLSVWYQYGQALNISHGNPAAPHHPAWKKRDRAVRREERHQAPLDVPDHELGRLVAELPPMWRACVLFCRFLGVRPSEARGVKAWGADNDFARTLDGAGVVVRIRRQRIVTHGDPWQCKPYLKSFEPARTLPVPPALWAELEPLILAGPPLVRSGRGGGTRTQVDFLFPIHTTNQVTDLNKAMQATGIVPEGRGLYVARHAFSRASAQAKSDVRELQKTMGHAWLSTTQGYIDRAGYQPTVSVELMAQAAPKGWATYQAGAPPGKVAVAVEGVDALSTATTGCQTGSSQPKGVTDEAKPAGFEPQPNVAKKGTEAGK